MQVILRPGDTLWRLANLFQVPLTLILDSNRTLNPQGLMPGQAVQIPGYVAATRQIAPGDTLWGIAALQQIPLDALLLANPGIQPSNLSVGQIINIPQRITDPVVEPQLPYNYATMMRDLNRLAAIYPFMELDSIGSSVMGKSIPEVRLGMGAKQVHVNGSFHGNEWITTPVLMKFLNQYLLALTNGGNMRGLDPALLYQVSLLSLVPMVNPDGVDLVIDGAPAEEPYRSQVIEINGGSTDFSGWKANIRGVDLNNQFPALWEREAARGPRTPAPRDYAGTEPLTEPESQAMARLAEARDFARVLAFHTQGAVIYWGFEGLEPPEAEALANEFARVSGYEAIRYADSSAGFKDWFIQDWRRPGFTVELGRGTNPLPISQFDSIYEESLGILLTALYR